MTIDIYEPVISGFAEMRTRKSDAELYRFNINVSSLIDQGIIIKRHDYEDDYNDFIASDLDEEIEEKGLGILPITFVNGERKLEGRYPSVRELKEWTGLKEIKTPSAEEQMKHLSEELKEHDHSHYHN